MTISPQPVEKSLLNLALGKGMDERVRGELNDGFTLIENLIQDQTGAWVKRPGQLLQIPADASGGGSYPIYPRKILNLVNGWGVIGNYGYLLHKQDGSGTFRQRQRLMDFSVTRASFIGSSGPAAQSTQNIITAASNSTFDAHVTTGLPHATGAQIQKLSLCERATGVETCYDLSLFTYPGTGGAGRDAQLCFVGDRYLHLYVTNNPGSSATDISLIVIDTATTIPYNEAAVVAAIPIVNVWNRGAGGLQVYDVLGYSDRSFVLYTNNTAQGYIGSHNGADGTQLEQNVLPFGEEYQSMDCDLSRTALWLVAKGSPTRLRCVTTTAINVDITATFTVTNPTGATMPVYICTNNSTGDCRLIYNVTTTTFGGTTINSITCATLALGAGVLSSIGSAYGWIVVSRPWFCGVTGNAYCHLCKSDTTNTLSSAIVGDISTFTPYVSNTGGLALPFGSFRVACDLEPNSAIQDTVRSGIARPYRVNDYQTYYEFGVAVSYQTAQRVAGVGFLRLRANDQTAMGAANFSGSCYVAHGGLNSYDGRNLVDQGFADQPTMNIVTPGATPGTLAGSYRYVAVFRHVDANGVSTYSRTYGPVSTVNVAASTGQNNITIQQHSFTNRDDGLGNSIPFVEIYRTKNGGTQYYLVSSSQGSFSGGAGINVTTGLLTFTDNMVDSTLITKAVMYRQPGTTNAPADRYAAPACKYVVQHKDRLFCTDPYGQRVYYSSFFVDGEAAWFNPAFNFYCHAGSGPITALASMDGRLFVFKRDAIFVVDGDGPGEAGPTGNEFSPPQSLASRYGCIDHRSVVVTPEGIIYRSSRGIEMLARSLKVTWIGERVDATLDLNPVTTGACVDSSSRYHITVAASEGPSGSYFVVGCELVYDMACDCWSVFRRIGADGVYGHCAQNVGVIYDAGIEKLAYADAYSGIEVAFPNECLDYGGTFVPFTIETGWIKQGPQARQRVSEVLFLAKKRADSNHALKISFAYDYVETYTQTHTWEPSDINPLTVEELLMQPTKQQVLAIRVKIEDAVPADSVTYPIGFGNSCDILAITAEVAPKLGTPKLAAGQKA